MLLSSCDREQTFQIQLRMQIPYSCGQDALYKPWKQKYISRFCNVPLFQVNIQGLATQFLMLDAKLANGALSMTSGLRTKIPLQVLQGYPCRFCTSHLTFVAIESTAINQYLCQHLNFFLLVQRIVGVFLAHQATIGNTPQDLSCLFFLGRFYF